MKNIKRGLSHIFLALMLVLANCTTHSPNKVSQLSQDERVSYDFSFDMRETPDVEILDYWLKTEGEYTINKHVFQTKQGAVVIQNASGFGPKPRPKKFYVKWRIKSTGQDYENTVDLSNRLPKDIAESTFTFLIQGAQLNIYLATRELRPQDWPIQGPKIHKINKVLRLYPDTAP